MRDGNVVVTVHEEGFVRAGLLVEQFGAVACPWRRGLVAIAALVKVNPALSIFWDPGCLDVVRSVLR
jgi:hypothetical protein